jgi:hypothetical protein
VCRLGSHRLIQGLVEDLTPRTVISQQEETVPLFLPELNKFHEASHVRGEDASNVAAIRPRIG